MQRRVAEPGTIEPFHRQHPAGRQLWIELRNPHMRRPREVARKLLQVTRFAPVVELTANGTSKLGHRRLRPIRLQLRKLLGQLSKTPQYVEVDLHPTPNSGMLHLNDDISTARQ